MGDAEGDAEDGTLRTLKIVKIGDVFIFCSTTSDAMVEWTSPFESARKIGLETPRVGSLMVVGGSRCRCFKIAKIGDVFIRCSTTRYGMAKWTSWFESAHSIGLKTPLKSKLNR